MLRSKIRTLARSYARTSTLGASDTSVNDLINLGLKEFAKDVHGLPADAFLAIQASFDLATTMAFRLTISGSTNNDIVATDVAVCAADSDDNTGTATAAILQTQIRAAIGAGADLTVAWSNFYFTIDGIDSTAITIESPTTNTYSDATARLFGGEQSGADSIVCGFPEDCTMYATLPTDYQTLTTVIYDGYPLINSPRSWTALPKSSGTPQYYTVIGTRIYLSPVPTEQKEFYIEYKAMPADMTSDTQVTPLIPEDIQIGIAYWVSAELLKGTFEEQNSRARYADYLKAKGRYMMRFHNATTEVDPQPRGPYPWYRVQT